MSSGEAGTQDHGVPALVAQGSAQEQDHGAPALEAQDSTHDHGVPSFENPTPADTDKILAAVAQLARRRRLELRRQRRTESAGAEEGESSKRVRPVSGTSAGSSRESAKVAPEPEEGAPAAVAVALGWPKSVSHGGTSVIGRRREMEDTFAIAAPFLVAAAGEEKEKKAEEGDGGGDGDAEVEFFAVYDGHGGARAADTCRERLHVVLAEEVARLHLQLGKGGGEDGGRWREAMLACFARVDEEVSAVERELHKMNAGDTVGCGCTAVVAVVGPHHIVVANCGDSRAVLSRGGVPVPLSSDHKPDRPDELERIESAGGRVINWNGSRVLGVLATSRAIGDYFMKPFMSAEPEVTVTERTNRDEFIILASDGLWDVMTNELACKIARNCLSGRAAIKFPDTVHGSSASDATGMLMDFAMSLGSSDNISVVVVELKRLKRWKDPRQNGRT